MATTEIEKLINHFSRFPGMGSRSATRIVIHLLKKKNIVMEPFLRNLIDVYKNSKICKVCGNIDTDDTCSICKNPKRDGSIICVVADISDLWSIERAGFYNGKYHVLGNKLSAIEGITPSDLNIEGLIKRIKDPENHVNEVIIAMSSDIDGQTTTFFVSDSLKDLGVKITTLSRGVPVGSELEYLDDGTIITAFNQRRDI